jgi:hypothetical protein
MYGATRTKLLICTLLLTSCASGPAQHQVLHGAPVSSTVAVPTTPHQGLSAADQNLFANIVAVVTAMGGNNPNLAYRALTTKGCIHNRIFTGPQPLDTRPGTQILNTATVTAPAPCQRLAAAR